MDKLSIKFINIDNNSMKRIVRKKFSVVPSIVVILEDEISLYTGENAFEWFNIFASNVLRSESEASSRSESEASSRSESEASSRSESEASSRSESEADEKIPKSILELASELSKARESLP
jgi:hypothetical protein